MNFNIKLFLIVLLFIFIYRKYFINQIDNFDNSFENKDFDDYNYYIYPLESKITKQENYFIRKWLNKLEKNDSSKYISTSTVGFTIFKNRNINKSRFSIGTLTKHREFKNDCMKILKKYNLNINQPRGYLWYKVAWDIEDKIIKVYLINKYRTKIICYVYSVARTDDNKILEMYFSSKKFYNINKDNTLMFKNKQVISQINTELLPVYLKKRYPESKKIISMMNNDNWELKIYSEYNNKLNLYFD